MISLTQKERETLLILFKDFLSFYNANLISKILNISHVGAQKIFKRLKKENLVIDTRIGKSIVYKINLKDDYTNQLISFLLADEANNFKRWKEEFKEISKKNRIIVIFGSAIKNYAQAKDIDIMVVINKNEAKEISKFISKKQEILPKKIHLIRLISGDLVENIKKRDKVMIDIVKKGVVLYGQNKYTELITRVTGV